MLIDHVVIISIWALFGYVLWRQRNIKMRKKDAYEYAALIIALLALFISITAYLLPSRRDTKTAKAIENLTEAIEKNNFLLETSGNDR